MGRFYVQEGNKRVSVLKYFDATSILGNVIRVVPQYSDDPAVQMYYEFMHFYPITQNYLLTFTKPGSYARLQKILGKGPDEKWSGDDRAEVLSLYNWVEKAFLAHGGAKLRCTVGDVLLLLLRVYTKEELAKLSPNELSEKLDALWDDVLALQKADPVRVSDKPAEPKQTGLLDRILPGKHTAPSHLKVAFVHERTPGTSSWTSQHEFGRTQLDTVFAGQVETTAYFNAVPGENADALVEQAIADGADVVFTTSPKLVGASLRAAVKHPQVRILNCSMEMPYASIRTYYTRVYEAKFITGAIAGAHGGHGPHRLCGRLPELWRTRQPSTPLRWAPAWRIPAPALSCCGPACLTRPTRCTPSPRRASRLFRAATHRCPTARSGSSAHFWCAPAAYCRTWLRRSGTGASSMRMSSAPF